MNGMLSLSVKAGIINTLRAMIPHVTVTFIWPTCTILCVVDTYGGGLDACFVLRRSAGQRHFFQSFSSPH